MMAILCVALCLLERSKLSITEVGDEMNSHPNMKRTGTVSPSTGDCSNSVVMFGKKKDNAYTWHRSCLGSFTKYDACARHGEAGGGGGARMSHFSSYSLRSSGRAHLISSSNSLSTSNVVLNFSPTPLHA